MSRQGQSDHAWHPGVNHKLIRGFATGLRHPGVNQLNARFHRIDNCRQIGCHDCGMATTTLLGFFLSTLLFKTTDGRRVAIGEASCYFSRWQVVQQCAVSFRQEQESHHHHVRVPTPTPPARAFSIVTCERESHLHLPVGCPLISSPLSSSYTLS